MSDKLKCVVCGKDVDITDDTHPPKWFGKFESNHGLQEVICHACISIPDNLKKWKEFKTNS